MNIREPDDWERADQIVDNIHHTIDNHAMATGMRPATVWVTREQYAVLERTGRLGCNGTVEGVAVDTR